MSEYKYEDEPDFWTARAMKQLGGSFVTALAEAWFRGDLRNRARIRNAFSDYFDEYRDMGMEMFKGAYPQERD